MMYISTERVSVKMRELDFLRRGGIMNKELVKEVMDKIEDISNLLYQEQLAEGNTLLMEIIPDLQKIISNIEDANTQEEFIQIFASAVEAMENKDSTLLGDILQYELGEKLKEFSENPDSFAKIKKEYKNRDKSKEKKNG